MFQWYVTVQFPEYTDAIKLVDDVIQAFYEDHNGTAPQDLLEFWEGKALEKLC